MSVNDGTQGNDNTMSAALKNAGVSPGQFAAPNAGGARAQQPTASASPSATSQTSAGTTAPKGNSNMQQPQNPGNQPGPTISLRNAGAGLRTMMPRSQASESLNKIMKALETIYRENADQTFEYTLIPIDVSNNTTLSVSVLVLAVRDKQNPNLGVAYHSLIVEAASATEFPQMRMEQIGGQNVEIMRLASDAYDPVLIEFVRNEVAKRFPNANLFNTDGTLVTKDVKGDDMDTMWKIAINAAFACSQELEVKAPGFRDLNLAFVQNDSNLVIRPTFHQNDTVDVLNHPVRAPIQIDFQAVPQNQNQQQQNVERTSQISRLCAFLDIVWDPEVPNQPQAFGAQGWNNQQPNYRRYAARAVITQLESNQLLTTPMQLLALLPALALREGNAWVQAFMPQAKSDARKDWTDIGAIGYEVNLENNPNGVGNYIDTKADSFISKPENLYRLIGMTFRDGMLLSLDVPELGGSSWYNGVFAAAAEGNVNANQAIIDAANELTNGAFQAAFPPNARVAFDENNRIHLGYYTDDKGNRQDLRRLDYLAVLNLTGDRGDLSAAKDWSDTFVRRDFHIAQRLALRKKIISNLVTDPVFTGYARRVTFTPEFLNALISACRTVGLSPRLAQNYQDLGVFERATGAHLTQAMMSSDPTQLFNRGLSGGVANASGLRSFGGRW